LLGRGNASVEENNAVGALSNAKGALSSAEGATHRERSVKRG